MALLQHAHHASTVLSPLPFSFFLDGTVLAARFDSSRRDSAFFS